MSKHSFGGKNIFNKGDEFNQIFHFAKVEVNIDDFDGGTILST